MEEKEAVLALAVDEAMVAWKEKFGYLLEGRDDTLLASTMKETIRGLTTMCAQQWTEVTARRSRLLDLCQFSKDRDLRLLEDIFELTRTLDKLKRARLKEQAGLFPKAHSDARNATIAMYDELATTHLAQPFVLVGVSGDTAIALVRALAPPQ